MATSGTNKTLGEPRRATNLTFSVSLGCLAAIILTVISVKLHSLYGLIIIGGALVVMLLPQNGSEKSRPCALPFWLFPVMHCASIVASAILAVSVITAVWEGVVFWTIAGGYYIATTVRSKYDVSSLGLLLYWRCDCCHCDVMEPLVEKATSKVDPHHVIYEFKGTAPGENSVIVAR